MPRLIPYHDPRHSNHLTYLNMEQVEYIEMYEAHTDDDERKWIIRASFMGNHYKFLYDTDDYEDCCGKLQTIVSELNGGWA